MNDKYVKAVENLLKKVQSGQVDANDLYSRLLAISNKYIKKDENNG